MFTSCFIFCFLFRGKAGAGDIGEHMYGDEREREGGGGRRGKGTETKSMIRHSVTPELTDQPTNQPTNQPQQYVKGEVGG